MPRSEPPSGRRISAVTRAVGVLEALADADEDLGTNELARRTGINPSSVSRLLATLAAPGLVAQDARTGRYRLGLRMLRYGTAVLARLDVREVARDHLRALAEATGETATLSVPGGGSALTVDFVQSSASVLSVARVGRPSVAHATAVGKVMLAATGRLPEGPLQACTDATITDPQQLRAEVDRARRRGWAEAVGEREADLHAVAVPVRNATGELLAVLGVQGPAGRFEAAERAAAVEHLQRAARQLDAMFAGEVARA